jgi:uncharacterized protein GlcG (DUF336 family)
MKKLGFIGIALVGGLLSSAPGFAQSLSGFGSSSSGGDANCSGLPSAATLRSALTNLSGHTIGGLFDGTRMWAAVVNRSGYICAIANSQTDPTQVWPGSLAIAKAKAYTANAFSLDTFALSTARLFTFTQPGHSLWSLGQSNLFNPQALQSPKVPPSDNGKIDGGLIFFGGGLPLYKGGKIVGGLGISGDTSCADHEVAKYTRDNLGLNPAGGKTADDIIYTGPSLFLHPKCIKTYQNDGYVGEETPAVSY